MACPEALRVQAYFDGELDASAAADIERHVEACGECAALLRSWETVRGGMRQRALYHRASPKLESRVARALDREIGNPWSLGSLILRGQQFWVGAASGVAATALAASLAFLVLLPPASGQLVNDVMGAHLRSLMENHLIDVVSSDQHTVKPWFAGHADVSPPTADFPKEDYRLVGGRAHYVDGHTAGGLASPHGRHTVHVLSV